MLMESINILNSLIIVLLSKQIETTSKIFVNILTQHPTNFTNPD